MTEQPSGNPNTLTRNKKKDTMQPINFSDALTLLKYGNKLSRIGWNGTNQFVYYVPADTYPTKTEIAKEAFGETVDYRAYLALKTVQGDVAVWVPSISDLLAEDWVVGVSNPKPPYIPSRPSKPPYIGQIVHYLIHGLNSRNIPPRIIVAMVTDLIDNPEEPDLYGVRLRLFHPDHHGANLPTCEYSSYGNEPGQWREIS